VSYRMVEPGEIKVSFEYKSEGGTKTLPAQTFEVKTGLGKPTSFTLDVTDKVDVVKPPDPATTTPEKSKASKGKSADADDEDIDTKAIEKARKETPAALQWVGALASTLFGLVVVGAIAYFLWWYIKNNQKQVQTVLTQAGVPVNQDPADPTGAAPIAPQAPQPIQKIVLDPNAAPIASAPASPMATTKNPRLLGDDGSMFMLSDGENTVGREPGLAVSVVGESSISRSHAQLTVLGGSVVLTDTGSTNGTFVNGMKVTGSTPLRPGDAVQFGARKFRFEE
ncbi:MAG: FHA domain-containing protein, partial [Armatimonadota bacterium]